MVVDDSSILALPNRNPHDPVDIPFDHATQLIDFAQASNAKGIVLSLLPVAHKLEAAQLKSFLSFVHSRQDKGTVLVAVPPSQRWVLPAEFQTAPLVVADQPCDEYL